MEGTGEQPVTDEPITPEEVSLDQIRGGVRRVGWPAVVSSFAAALPLLWLVSAGVPIEGEHPAWWWYVLAGVAILGLIGLAGSAIAFLHLYWRAGRAAAEGASWTEIAEAAGGKLDLRSSVSLLLMGFLPLPLLVIGALIVPDGVVGRMLLWIITLGPTLLLGLLVKPRPEREVDLPEKPASRGRMLLLRATATITALIVLGAVGAGMLVLGVAQWSRQVLRSTAVEGETMHFPRNAAYRYRLPVEPRLDATEAGGAIEAVLRAGDTTNVERLRPLSVQIREPWLKGGIDEAVGVPLPQWPSTLLQDAADGFEPQTRIFLTQALQHPATTLLTGAARAPEADLIDARYGTPFSPGATVLDLPLPSFEALHEAAFLQVGRAALQLDAGNRGQAERTLREVVSLGTLLHAEATGRAEAAAALGVTRIGLASLVTFYGLTGRTADAEAIHKALEEQPAARDPRIVDRGATWDELWRHTARTCIDVPALVFAPPAEYTAQTEDLARVLIRRPSDQAWFDLIAGRRCSPLAYL